MTDEILHIVGGLDWWDVHLKDRSLVRVKATSFSQDEHNLTFSALKDGEPATLIDTAVFPSKLVDFVDGPKLSDTSF